MAWADIETVSPEAWADIEAEAAVVGSEVEALAPGRYRVHVPIGGGWDVRDYEIVATRPARRFAVAVYELDRVWGGPEEGGWWYDAGRFVRLVRVVRGEAAAFSLARRVNRTLTHRREAHPFRPISSVAYDGGHLEASVWEDVPPAAFPDRRPHYE